MDKKFFLIIARMKREDKVCHFLTANRYADNVHAKLSLNDDIKEYSLFPLELTNDFSSDNSSFDDDDLLDIA